MNKKICYILIITLALLSSCASSDEDLVLNKYPTWIENEKTDESIYPSSFIIEGSGETLDLASIDAINNFYDILSRNIYIENEFLFKESLFKNYYYEPFDMRIEKRYIDELISGGYVVIYYISSDETIIKNNTLKQESLEQNISKQLIEYESMSNKLYRDNKDLSSIKTLIEAYIYAMDNGFEVDGNDYLKTIISRISAININIYSKKNINNLQIKLNRDERIIDPIIISAEMKVLYNNVDNNFKNYLVSDTLYPNKDGSFYFNIDNKKINEEGLLVFMINLDDELKLLNQKGYKIAADRIYNVIEEKIYSYSKKSLFENKTIYLKTIENDIKQNALDSISINFFKEKLESLNSIVIIDEDIDINNLAEYSEKGDYLFLFRAEIVEEQSSYKYTTLSHGSLEIYDLNDSSLYYDSTLFDSIYISDDLENSKTQSILNVAKKVLHNLLR
ncbi:MAG: hypothetical protein ACPKM0_08060 [Pleomorphochaeta sp.]